jgi:hypothetical protein
MEELFVLRPVGGRFGRKFAYAEQVDPVLLGDSRDQGVCPCCGDGLGMLPWLPPHRIALSSSRYPDFLWGGGFFLLVSQRFRELYETSDLAGITRFDPPAEVVRVGAKSPLELRTHPPTYFNVWYERSGGNLDDRQSRARRPKVLCNCCRQDLTAIERVVLKPSTWAGYDLFAALGLPGHILVTERFRKNILEHTLCGAEMIPAGEYHFDFD